MPDTPAKLVVEKNDLDAVPVIPVPDGYTLRTFQPGDEPGLARIYAASGLGTETAEAVRQRMLEHPCFAPERIYVIEHGGVPVATCSAWVWPDKPGEGSLHMLAVAPEHRGKRLGAIVAIETIKHARREGFTRQHLFTDDDRDAALRLYLSLGYYPVYTDPTHPARWAAICARLGFPEALDRAHDRR